MSMPVLLLLLSQHQPLAPDTPPATIRARKWHTMTTTGLSRRPNRERSRKQHHLLVCLHIAKPHPRQRQSLVFPTLHDLHQQSTTPSSASLALAAPLCIPEDDMYKHFHILPAAALSIPFGVAS
ncbi:hypothetical protein MIND_00798500 [Mycena indigotica]|uniref:Uncharacterized protein n=1 Tax=Mycena indigotica TaxID=2126181 RepID=A0A8H6SFM6_9AGAR|nr:uncharacterized protein MIND_00798500 [Mycena indigotica]KAF7298519.1 hypothetical protein MIND_00798500 [Mycena indigotica]